MTITHEGKTYPVHQVGELCFVHFGEGAQLAAINPEVLQKYVDEHPEEVRARTKVVQGRSGDA